MKRFFAEAWNVLRYRGGSGQWSFVLHRLTGVAVMLFLLVHIIDTALLGWGPEVYDRVMKVYTHPFFRLNEIVLFGAVLYHALNGMRIILVDFWPGITRHHRKLDAITWAAFVVLMIPVTLIMLNHAFGKEG